MTIIIEEDVNKLVKLHETCDPIRLAKLCGCNILYSDLDADTWGFTVNNNRCNTIIVNQHLKKELQKFTIAHELGHVRLHKGISTPFLKKVARGSFIPTIEKEANMYAFSILCKNVNNIDTMTKYQILDCLGLSYEMERFL